MSIVLAAVALILAFYSPDSKDVSGQVGVPQPMPQIAGVKFDKAINLTNNTHDSVYGQVVASEGDVYVVWQDSVISQPSTDGGYIGRNYDIFMIKSNDAGDSFDSPVNLSINPGFSEHPQAAVYDDDLHVVWADNTSGNREILFSTSRNGSDFDTAINISDTDSDSSNAEIAVFETNVHVVWLEHDDTNSRVLLKTSRDGGTSFEKTIVISDKATSTTLPKVSAHEKGVHVAWSLIDDTEESALFYSGSSDAGIRFSEPIKLSDLDDFGEPQLVAKNQTVYVVSGGVDTIEVAGLLVAKSTDAGANFSTQVINVNGSFVNPLNVEAALDGTSTLYVAGQVFVSDDEEILLLPLDVRTGEATPLGLANLSENEKISECPSIAIAGDKIFVVWEDLSPGNHEILYAKGTKI
jgi:hypothetical protein